MNTKTIIAAVIGGLSSFLLGWLFYGILFKDALAGMCGSATGVMRADDQMVFWALALGNVVIGYLVAYIFSNWAGINTFIGGAKAGALLGLLFSLGFDLIMYATSNITTLNGVFLDVLIQTIMWAISAAFVGWWLGRSA
ncbi:MAG: hypothetical protein IPO78_03700 [Saprospiraceae bacterium]|nr:hypothetical protein [Saprospiraceae bacterium]MBK8450902.1 hypothetical protein [Saprospiraceae bacterium]MBK8485018.1 hypothetical protein [Saprospiraceae bacterium]MBK9223178.1 hypothetical protein [Saprospiraceae bacterium]MBK9720706.1 hypothetical protein [Saprospiraceae bacterium]